MNIVNPLIEDYALENTSVLPKLLMDVYEFTAKTHPQPNMQSSVLQGNFLSFISQILQPTYILEVGCLYGFSTLCLAAGLSINGQLHTIDIRNEEYEKTKQHCALHEKKNQLFVHLGDAKKIIPSLPFAWDLVFIDADKTGYIDYYNLILPNLSKNGIILVDNVLFHGEVINESNDNKSVQAIKKFNELIKNDIRVDKIILTIRDGITIIKKKQC